MSLRGALGKGSDQPVHLLSLIRLSSCAHAQTDLAGPFNAVGSESDCESRGRWFEPKPGHILP